MSNKHDAAGGRADAQRAPESESTLGTVRVEVVRTPAQGCGGEAGADAPTSVYEVPYGEHTTVLDALTWIKDNIDPTLTFRWSCRMAICGSCGVMVNGRPVLGCETFARGYRTSGLQVAPLEHFQVLRDLVVDTDGFVDKIQSLSPWLIPAAGDDGLAEADAGVTTAGAVGEAPAAATTVGTAPERAVPAEPLPLAVVTNTQTPAQMAAFHDFAQCINCMLCYSACPQLDVVPGFVGPAAVALARRWDVDSRDAGELTRADAMDTEEGVWPCIQNGSCTQVCPRGVDPARSLRDAQRVATETWEARQG